MFDDVQKAVCIIQKNTKVDRMPSIAKKETLQQKIQKTQFLSSFPKTKSTQTSRSVFAERTEQVKKTRYELEILKILDCFLDGYGSFSSLFVTFEFRSS